MLQPDAFCEHTMQQNATAAGASGAYSAPPDSLAGFKGDSSRKKDENAIIRGKGGKGKGEEK